MHRLLLYLVSLLLWQLSGSLAGFFDGLQRPVEITTVSHYLPGPVRLQRTAGRTRRTMSIDQQNATFDGKMVDNYCCFWVYQKHPEMPKNWEHRAEYPFDFLLNGIFVKNERNFTEPKAVRED
ncbi:uncharacterized protein DMAD_09193 [Drosophila madeirensis]|uniref:Uncharacterized protein n=1 Tax=Drosophila madeirensis TaxID=30013 RepID=A0AAU9EWS3_DROMD